MTENIERRPRTGPLVPLSRDEVALQEAHAQYWGLDPIEDVTLAESGLDWPQTPDNDDNITLDDESWELHLDAIEQAWQEEEDQLWG